MCIHLSIVSPVYSSEECLTELYRRALAAAAQITPNFELVLVDDASPDQSWAVLQEIAAGDPRVQAIRLSRNLGQHYAISAGLDHARGAWVVVMDCDLQDPPEEISTLYHKVQEGYDMVFARRKNRKDSWIKRARSYLFARLISWLTGTGFDGTLANFSICSQRAIDAFRKYRERDRAYFLIMSDIGYPMAYVDVEHSPRFAGTTSYSLGKLLRFALQVALSSSTRPLHLSIRLGMTIAGLSILHAAYLVARYFLINVGVAGWTTLAVLISFLFGLLFMQLGVIGLYLGRTFEESKRRPLYHIAEHLNAAGQI